MQECSILKICYTRVLLHAGDSSILHNASTIYNLLAVGALIIELSSLSKVFARKAASSRLKTAPSTPRFSESLLFSDVIKANVEIVPTGGTQTCAVLIRTPDHLIGNLGPD